jgi:oxygen-independent coproporphyrinogen-3 oxidase
VTLPEEALRASEPPRSLYVHAPFCRQRCHYCDFSVTRTDAAPVAGWLEALSRELASWFESTGWPRPLELDTLFVGGGTPSLLGASGMERLALQLEPWFVPTGSTEWTVEANPDSTSAALCAAWREAGVTRLSLGVQSFHDGVLGWLGRLHDADGARAAIQAAGEAGFADLNIDLIFGLPADVERDWAVDLEEATALGVTHISAYGLTAEPRTPLGRGVVQGQVRMPGQERYADEYRLLARQLTDRGFIHYEVSNFARPDCECRHNWQYWNGGAYLGLGPSAHSYLPPFRMWNVFQWDAYRRAVCSGQAAGAGVERVDGEDLELERTWLSLRTRAGLSAGDPAWAGDGESLLERWIEAGWLQRDGDRVRATVEGWLRLDELVTKRMATRGEAQTDPGHDDA